MATRRNRGGTAGEGGGTATGARAGGHVPGSSRAPFAVSSIRATKASMSVDAGGVPEKMLAIHKRLRKAGIDHAFGGALALAWCTQQARGTIDVDVNIFVGPERTDDALAALPDHVVATADDRAQLLRGGQARLWWGTTPIDVFLSTTDFHE